MADIGRGCKHMTGRQGRAYDLSQARHQLISALDACGVVQAVYQLPINCQTLEEFDALHHEWVLKSIFHLK